MPSDGAPGHAAGSGHATLIDPLDPEDAGRIVVPALQLMKDALHRSAVRTGIEAKQGVGPDGIETFVLTRSVALPPGHTYAHVTQPQPEDHLTGG